MLLTGPGTQGQNRQRPGSAKWQFGDIDESVGREKVSGFKSQWTEMDLDRRRDGDGEFVEGWCVLESFYLEIREIRARSSVTEVNCLKWKNRDDRRPLLGQSPWVREIRQNVYVSFFMYKIWERWLYGILNFPRLATKISPSRQAFLQCDLVVTKREIKPIFVGPAEVTPCKGQTEPLTGLPTCMSCLLGPLFSGCSRSEPRLPMSWEVQASPSTPFSSSHWAASRHPVSPASV